MGAALATPIGLYGAPIGTLLVSSSSPRAWTDGDAAAAEAYASVLAALLELAAEARRRTGLPRQVQNLLHGQAAEAAASLLRRLGRDPG